MLQEIHGTLQEIHGTVHEIHGTLYKIHGTLHEMYGMLHEIHGTLHEIHGTLRQTAPDRYLEDFPCKEEKVEDFVLKLEEVVETKVAYFYTTSLKNSKVSDQDSNQSQTMTLTVCPVGRVP